MDSQIYRGLPVPVAAWLVPRPQAQVQVFTMVAGLKLLCGLVIGLFLLTKVYRIFIYPYLFSPHRHLPTPKHHVPFLGHIPHKISYDNPTTPYREWSNTWPDAPFIRYYGFAGTEVLVANSIAAVKAIRQTYCFQFEKPAYYVEQFSEILGKAMLLSEGEENRRARKFMAASFSVQSVQRLLPMFKTKADDLVAFMDESIVSNAGVLDITHLFSKATLDIIALAALGIELNNLKPSAVSPLNFHDCYGYVLNMPKWDAIVHLINSYVPIRWLPLPANRRFKGAMSNIWRMLSDLLHARVRAVKRDVPDHVHVGGERTDMLEHMLKMSLAGDRGMDRVWIAEMTLQLLIAGHETSSLVMLWSTHTLAKNPAIQSRLRNEILRMLAANPDPDYAAIHSLCYLNNFLREAVRCHPPSIAFAREAKVDVTIEGVIIPAGTIVELAPAALQFSTSIWGSDADIFDPDRWDRYPPGHPALNPYTVDTFGNGPRICPGKGFGEIEIKLLLIKVLSNFVVEVEDEMVVLENPAISNRPKEALRVRARRL